MRILSIETSCDETAVSVLDATGTVKNPKFKLLGNALYSQAKIHAKYGGVYPNLAKRVHQKNLIPLLKVALKEAGEFKVSSSKLIAGSRKLGVLSFKFKVDPKINKILEREPELLKQFIKEVLKIKRPKIDAIAVTFGPGLEPTLWVGITFAKALGTLWGIPVVPVNHMEGHVVSVLFHKTETVLSKKFKVLNTKNYKRKAISYPALALLISGGHTELVIAKSPLKYKTIGQTRDDALGECYDKVARMLGLPYPGGPEISKLASEGRKMDLNPQWFLPRPMINSGNLDFSFSGLKTSVLYKIKAHGKLSKNDKIALAKEFEDAVVEVLVSKTRKAIDMHKPKSLVVGGGVIANPFIREKLGELALEYKKLSYHIPERDLATDNSVMIGMAGYLRVKDDPKLLRSKKEIRALGTVSLG